VLFGELALAAQNVGDDALGAEDIEQIFLTEVTGFHQMADDGRRFSFRNGIVLRFIFLYQYGEQSHQLLFGRCDRLFRGELFQPLDIEAVSAAPRRSPLVFREREALP